MKTTKEEPIETAADPLESLLGSVSARPKPPADIERAVYRHVLEDWKKVSVNRKRKKMVYWSVAASFLAAMLAAPLLFQLHDTGAEAPALGLVQIQVGSVSVREGGELVQPSSGDSGNYLFAGQSVMTAADSGASIDWGAGDSIRVDQNTELHLLSKSEIELVAGKIYVDIPAAPSGGPSGSDLSIVTRFGSVRHIGTQFMVSSGADNVEVKVREGSVAIDKNGRQIVSHGGQQATLDESDRVEQENILTYGPEWQWTEQLAPSFALEGKTLGEFLNWVGRETGNDIAFESTAAEDIARQTVMHGDIDEAPLPAMELVLQTTVLSWHQQDGKIFLAVNE